MGEAYYNENDDYAATWLEALIDERLIAPGVVDRRSIVEVMPADLEGFTQCHFFAGIGGWSYALRLAGWPDDEPIWTGSCPCQPFSVAGAKKGFDDARHLWPEWCRLIRKRRPSVITGEQVASALSWFDVVYSDLEAEDYAVGAAILGAHSTGGHHLRQRLYFVADTNGPRRERSQPFQCVPLGTETAQSISRNTPFRARYALDGDYRDILPCDGLSVQLERHAIRGYGNAIYPPTAAAFIKAYVDTRTTT